MNDHPVCDDPSFTPWIGFPSDMVEWSLAYIHKHICRPGKVWVVFSWVNCWIHHQDPDGDFIISFGADDDDIYRRFPASHIVIHELTPN